jgi:alpha-D-ribose 1-methylphosphonate 5-triphosphate synthase subunit PhnG
MKDPESTHDTPTVADAMNRASTQRSSWMRLLALAQPDELEAAMAQLGTLPERQWLRKPETGMTMVQGRSGGTGVRFNLGEMTITRCALSLGRPGQPLPAGQQSGGKVGIAYVQGRSARHAESAACADALLQLPEWHAQVEEVVLIPLKRAQDARRAASSEAVARTRVDFFTMNRGENPDE